MHKEPDGHFQKLVASGQPVGEVIAVDGFLIEAKGLQPVTLHALVMFEDGSRGYIQDILEDHVSILHLGVIHVKVGMVAVLTGAELAARVGKEFIGRVVSVLGDPLDGKGPIAADTTWPIFNNATSIYQRELLKDQLETGVTSIDAIFPIVRGQRLALLGDTKSGKSTMATQIAINQRDTDQVVVYVLIAKRRSDVNMLLTRLNDNKAMSKTIVVVATAFESLVMSYLAPYAGCSMAEYLWQVVGQDTVIIYDDLTAHAHAHREISLLSGVSPGRDSYPGDMFHAHSSLLERAGRLNANHKCLTAVPIVLADAGDITAFLPTNIMSITDGQWILDMEVFRSGVRPALNIGLSVTRVGGVGHNERQKKQNGQILKAMAGFRSAEEFSRFGSELSPESQKDLLRGKSLQEAFTQKPGETYNLMSQQIILHMILDSDPNQPMDMNKLKELATQIAKQIKTEDDFAKAITSISTQLNIQMAPPEAPKPAPPPAQAPTAAAPTQPAVAPAAEPTKEVAHQ